MAITDEQLKQWRKDAEEAAGKANYCYVRIGNYNPTQDGLDEHSQHIINTHPKNIIELIDELQGLRQLAKQRWLSSELMDANRAIAELKIEVERLHKENQAEYIRGWNNGYVDVHGLLGDKQEMKDTLDRLNIKGPT